MQFIFFFSIRWHKIKLVSKGHSLDIFPYFICLSFSPHKAWSFILFWQNIVECTTSTRVCPRLGSRSFDLISLSNINNIFIILSLATIPAGYRSTDTLEACLQWTDYKNWITALVLMTKNFASKIYKINNLKAWMSYVLL